MAKLIGLLILTLVLAASSWAEVASTWVLWIETTEWIEPTAMRDVLRGEGLRGKKSWKREETVYKALNACELQLPKRISSLVESYRASGFTVIRDDEDGPSRFVRSGLPGSRWCRERGGCVIAGSSGPSNLDGRERLTDHSLYCLLDTVDPRGPKEGGR